MAVLRIVVEGEGVLRRKAQTVKRVTKRIQKLLNDMLETMHAADGVGLAAPQVGESLRVIVVDVGQGPLELINPQIVEAAGRHTDLEGCLSIPGRVGYVTRAAEVTVTGLDRHGEPTRVHGTGLLARALQHEIDHLDGVLFIDRADEVWEKKGTVEKA